MGLDDAGAGGSRGLDPMARLVSYGIAAVEPGMFGLGPIGDSTNRKIYMMSRDVEGRWMDLHEAATGTKTPID